MALADTARLLASLELDSSKFNAGTRAAMGGLNNLETKGQKVGRSLGFVGHTLSTALGFGLTRIVSSGVGALGGAIRDGVAGAQELEKVTAATGQVLKSTGSIAGLTADDIVNLSNKYEDLNATIDNKVIQSGENLLLTFTSIKKDAFEPALEAALNLNQAMGGGEAGLKGTIIQVGKALNDPVKGLTALRKVGVSFSEQQQKRIKALVKEGDLYGAQKIILAELSKEFGGQFKTAGDTAEGRAAALADSVDDLKITFATGLLPGIENVRKALTETFKDPATVKAVKDAGTAIGAFLSPGNIKAGIGLVKDAFGAIKDVPWGVIKDAFALSGGAAKAALDLFNGAPDWLKTAVLTGWGLNKITGGLAGDLFSGLASGLIKGVLSMNAGVVNINAATVAGGGGSNIPGVAGGAAAAGGPGAAAALGLSAASLGIIGAGIGAAAVAAVITSQKIAEKGGLGPALKPITDKGLTLSPNIIIKDPTINGTRVTATGKGGGLIINPNFNAGATGGVGHALFNGGKTPASTMGPFSGGPASWSAITKPTTDGLADVRVGAAKGFSDVTMAQRTAAGTIASAVSNTASRIASAIQNQRVPTVITNVDVHVTPQQVQKSTNTQIHYGKPNGSAGGGHSHATGTSNGII